MGIFHRCHARRLSGWGPPQWERTDLPAGGGLDVQDAWLMEALDYVRDVMNRLEQDLWGQASKRKEKRTDDRG